MRENEVLELILKYKMTEEHAIALKIAYMFILQEKQYFPDSKGCNFNNKDPRKSELFRYCLKLLKETKGRIQSFEYQKYIEAQFIVLKNSKSKFSIQPCCITGEKAWNRWLVVKRISDRKILKTAKSEMDLTETKKQLEKTKAFLQIHLGALNSDKIKNNQNKIITWANDGQISKIYLKLSPSINKSLTQDIDINTNSEIENLFKNMFDFEFNFSTIHP